MKSRRLVLRIRKLLKIMGPRRVAHRLHVSEGTIRSWGSGSTKWPLNTLLLLLTQIEVEEKKAVGTTP